MSEFQQIVNQSPLYLQGFQMQWLPGQFQIQVSPGQCRDSTNSIDIVSNNNLIFDLSVVGVGGVERAATGNQTYNLYILFDPTGKQPPALIADVTRIGTLPIIYSTGPSYLYGYYVYRRIGYFTTNLTNLNNMQQSGNNTERMYNYDFPQSAQFNANSPNYNIVAFTPLMPNVPGLTAIIAISVQQPASFLAVRTLGSPNNNNQTNYIYCNTVCLFSGSYPIVTAASGGGNPAVEYSCNNTSQIRWVGYMDSL